MTQSAQETACQLRMNWGWIVAVVLLSSCALPTPRSTSNESADWVRAASPHDIIQIYYGDPALVPLLIEELEDVAVEAKKGQRMGDGWLEVTMRDEKGRRLPTWLVGGKLVVEGQAGQAYQVVVENTGDTAVELVPMADGLSLLTGEAGRVVEPGLVLAPRQKYTLGKVAPKGGNVIRFSEVRDVDAVHRVSMTGTHGAIQLLVFGPAAADIFELGAGSIQRSQTGGLPEGRLNKPRYEGRRIPYQFR